MVNEEKKFFVTTSDFVLKCSYPAFEQITVLFSLVHLMRKKPDSMDIDFCCGSYSVQLQFRKTPQPRKYVQDIYWRLIELPYWFKASFFAKILSTPYVREIR